MNPKDIVRSGYDKVSRAYRADTFDYEHSGYKTFLAWLELRLNPGASACCRSRSYCATSSRSAGSPNNRSACESSGSRTP